MTEQRLGRLLSVLHFPWQIRFVPAGRKRGLHRSDYHGCWRTTGDWQRLTETLSPKDLR